MNAVVANRKLVSLKDVDERMSADELMKWLSLQLNRVPEISDLYEAGKTLYYGGFYGCSANVLTKYAGSYGALPPGNHLLGYALWKQGALSEAVQNFKISSKSREDTVLRWILRLFGKRFDEIYGFDT
eukprot:474247_1